MTEQHDAYFGQQENPPSRIEPSKEAIFFAECLRKWRLEKGLTQDELAKISDVSKSSISMAERAFNHLPPKEITQSRLAAALGISIQELHQLPPSSQSQQQSMQPKPSIQLRGVYAVAASPFNERPVDDLLLPSKWLLGATDNPDELTYLVISDASMQPTLRIGDVAILEPLQRLGGFPGAYLVRIDCPGGEVDLTGIRRVERIATGKLRASCDNERFELAQDDNENSFEILAKVLMVIRHDRLE